MEICHATLIVFIDNTSVLYSCRKGRSKSEDLNKLVIILADLLSRLDCDVTFKWVPSKYNIADFPSRGIALPSHWGVRQVPTGESINSVYASLLDVQ